MTLPNSRLSFKDCFDLMDQALSLPEGARALIGQQADAWRFRLRLNKARYLDRRLNAQSYESSHPLHGGSEYDELMFTIREDTEDQWWVYLQKQKAPATVEPIEEAAE